MALVEEEEVEEKKWRTPRSHGGKCSYTLHRYRIHTLHNLHSIHTRPQVRSLEAFYMSSEEEFGEFEGGAGQ